MDNAFMLAHVLACLVAVNVLYVNGQSRCCPTESCCKDSCGAPPPLNISLEQIAEQSTFYVAFLPNIPIFAGVDNICYTFIHLPDDTYIAAYSTVFTTGLNTVETFTFTSDTPGIFDFGSATCNQRLFDFALIDDGNPNCSLLISYACFRFGECFMELNNDIPVIAYTPINLAISNDCLARAENLITMSGVPDQDYLILPMKREPQCVTKIPCAL